MKVLSLNQERRLWLLKSFLESWKIISIIFVYFYILARLSLSYMGNKIANPVTEILIAVRSMIWIVWFDLENFSPVFLDFISRKITVAEELRQLESVESVALTIAQRNKGLSQGISFRIKYGKTCSALVIVRFSIWSGSQLE